MAREASMEEEELEEEEVEEEMKGDEVVFGLASKGTGRWWGCGRG